MVVIQWRDGGRIMVRPHAWIRDRAFPSQRLHVVEAARLERCIRIDKEDSGKAKVASHGDADVRATGETGVGLVVMKEDIESR